MTSGNFKAGSALQVFTSENPTLTDDSPIQSFGVFECKLYSLLSPFTTIQDERETSSVWEECGTAHTSSIAQGSAQLRPGFYQFFIRSVDKAGNAEAEPLSSKFIVPFKDDQAIQIVQVLPDNASLVFFFVGNRPNFTFQCRLETSDWFPCTSPYRLRGLPGSNTTFRVAPSSNDLNVPSNNSVVCRRQAFHSFEDDCEVFTIPKVNLRASLSASKADQGDSCDHVNEDTVIAFLTLGIILLVIGVLVVTLMLRIDQQSQDSSKSALAFHNPAFAKDTAAPPLTISAPQNFQHLASGSAITSPTDFRHFAHHQADRPITKEDFSLDPKVQRKLISAPMNFRHVAHGTTGMLRETSRGTNRRDAAKFSSKKVHIDDL